MGTLKNQLLTKCKIKNALRHFFNFSDEWVVRKKFTHVERRRKLFPTSCILFLLNHYCRIRHEKGVKMNLLRVNQVCAKLSVSRPTFYRILKDDKTFPRPIPLTKDINVYNEQEIEEWVNKRAGKNDKCI